MLNEERTFVFPAVEKWVPEARKRVRRVVCGWGFTDELSDTAELLASELVTNAVLHATGGSSCRVICARSGAVLTVSVIDHGAGVPVLRQGSATEPGGRGLFLVASLADDWGVRPVPRGKSTYFVLKGDRGAAGGPHTVEESGGRGDGDDAGTACTAGQDGTGRVRPAVRAGRRTARGGHHGAAHVARGGGGR